MPLPIIVANKLMKKYEEYRKTGNYFYADAKCQVSVEYVKDTPKSFTKILISASHNENLTNEQIYSLILENVINPVLKEYKNIATDKTEFIVNPSGKFTIWGSFADSGCVGRKIIVDTYGGVGRVGGGCFSSKNATKIDRSGAYYARYVAKNIVARGLADRCEIQVSYGIGIAEPLSMYIDTFKTEKVDLKEIYKYVKQNFNFKPANIIEELNLLTPIYKQTACYGHFGWNNYTWEQIKN